jgi:putative peptidoglycan lipid II flippase
MPEQDTTHSIIKSARRFFSGTMISRATGLLRDVSMAFVFGTNEAIAAFLVAFRFAHLLRRLLGEGALQSAFIPHFETLRHENPQRACSFFRDLFVTLSLGLTALIFLLMFGLGSAIYLLDLSAGNREIIYLTILLMPSLLFICLFGVNASLLQCEKNYFTSGVAPVAFNVIWTIGVLSLWRNTPEEAMPWLAGWVILACLCQWLITLPKTLAILRSYGLKDFWEKLRIFSTDVRRLGKPLFLGILGVAASQVNNALDAVFARYADGEGPAMLWYAIRIQQLPLALFGIAISGALLPPLTRALKNNDLSKYYHFLVFTLRRSIALMLPITAAIFVMGDSAIQLIYGRGGFTDASTIGTSWCLWGYAIGLIPMTLILILAPAFYAQGDYRTPAIASVVSMSLNIALNAILIMGLGYGPGSVAVATSVSAWVNFIQLAYSLPNSSAMLSPELARSAVKVFVSCVFACLIVIGADWLLFQGSNAWLMWDGKLPVFPHHFVEQISRFAVQFICFILAAAGMAWLLNASDLLRLAGKEEFSS